MDVCNIDGSILFCDVCVLGSIECVKFLLFYGVKVNFFLYIVFFLYEVCMSGSFECVRFFIDVGVNLEVYDCYFGIFLYVVCVWEYLDCVKVLFNVGVNVNVVKFYEIVFYYVVKVKNVDFIEMFIEFGGNIYVWDNCGKKLFDYMWSSSVFVKCFEYYEKIFLILL